MQDDLIKVAKLVLSGELKFTDNMLLALYNSLEEEISDAVTCDRVLLDASGNKLYSQIVRLNRIRNAICKKFNMGKLKQAEEDERIRISNLGCPINIEDDLYTIGIGLKSNGITTSWNVKYVDDIDTNPIDCVWTVAALESKDPCVTVKRFYKIVPYHKVDAYGEVKSKEPKYFCLYESLGVEDSNTSLVAIYESFCQAGFSIYTQMRKINLLKAYFDKT